jgi:parallel beta-helix repeat protein
MKRILYLKSNYRNLSRIKSVFLSVICIVSLQAAFAVDGQIDILPSPTSGYTISNPGSYILVADVKITASDIDGIFINAPDVTIDLNGHRIVGPGSGTGVGIRCEQNLAFRTWIFNGKVSNFSTGVVLADNSTIEDVVFYYNKADGIKSYKNCHILRCKAIDNNNYGIYAGESNYVGECIATGNNKSGDKAGIYALQNSIVKDCISNYNMTPSGLSAKSYGIQTSYRCKILNNNVHGNSTSSTSGSWGVYGIATGSYCIITANNCTENSCSGANSVAIGIFTDSDCTITGNVCNSNAAIGTQGYGYGIFCKERCLVENNHCYGNTAVNNGNSGIGIFADGVESRVFNNTCSRNLGNQMASIGIKVKGNGCRVEGNYCTGHSGVTNNSDGIFVDQSTDCIVIRNHTSNNASKGLTVGNTGNYVAENMASDGISIGTNTAGTGDRSNITY